MPADSLALHILERADSLLVAQSYHEAIAAAQEAERLYREQEDNDGIAESLSIQSVSSYRLGYLQTALALQELTYQFDLESGDSSRISSSLNNLASYCATLEYTDQAAELVQQAISYEIGLGNSRALAIRYGLASEIALKRNRPDEAVTYALKALELDESGGRAEQAAMRRSQLAAAYMGRNDYASAMACLEKAIPVLEAAGNRNSLAISLHQRGLIALRQGRNGDALPDLQRTYALAEEIGSKYLERNSAHSLALALEDTRPREALEYLKTSYDLSDSLYRLDAARHMADFQVRYDLAAKEHEIALREETLRRKKTQVVLLMVLTGILLVGIISLWTALRKRSRRNAALLRAGLLKDKLLALQQQGGETTETLHEISSELEKLGAKPSVQLSAREREVARYCCEGLIAKEIADKMNISVRTVETHKTNIFRKLGIGTTVELVRLMGQIQ